MNSTAIEQNNLAIDSLHSKNLVLSFNTLVKACAEQSRVTSDGAKSRGSKSSSSRRKHHRHNHGGNTEAPGHLFEYTFDDCSSHLASFHSGCDGGRGDPAISPQHMLCFKFIRIKSPLSTEKLNDMCDCGISWVLGYNLSILCAFIGLRIPEGGQCYLRKAVALLRPIHRTALRKRSASLFWTILKLSVLNNYAMVLRECSMDNTGITATLGAILRASLKAQQLLDPLDFVKFERSLRSLDQHDQMAPAA